MADLAYDCWYLTGPTASGKTTVGLELAQRIGAEIISLDSMAVYRGMDIGTAKPTPDEQRRVAHHLIDVADPVDEFTVSDYVQAARAEAERIRARGSEVLFVGGTPLYLKALLRGLFQGPPADWSFRRQIQQELRQVGTEALHQRLQLVDPVSASRLHPNDVRRIIRALEVHRSTGQPISHLQLQFDEAADPQRCRVFVLEWPRDQLHQRINRRVEKMWAQGLADEARALLHRYGSLGRTASQAVGYREAFAFLGGQSTRQETIDHIKRRTRRFARRQLTWFRSLVECRPVPIGRRSSPAEVARHIADAGRSLQGGPDDSGRPESPLK